MHKISKLALAIPLLNIIIYEKSHCECKHGEKGDGLSYDFRVWQTEDTVK